jgi:hypothetical protein
MAGVHDTQPKPLGSGFVTGTGTGNGNGNDDDTGTSNGTDTGNGNDDDTGNGNGTGDTVPGNGNGGGGNGNGIGAPPDVPPDTANAPMAEVAPTDVPPGTANAPMAEVAPADAVEQLEPANVAMDNIAPNGDTPDIDATDDNAATAGTPAAVEEAPNGGNALNPIVPFEDDAPDNGIAEDFSATYSGFGAFEARIDIPLDEFRELYLDGELWNFSEDYTVRSGSTILSVAEERMSKIGNGDHTFFAVFANQTVKIALTLEISALAGGTAVESVTMPVAVVDPSASAPISDNALPIIIIVAVGVVMVGTICLIVAKKRTGVVSR